MVPRLWLDNISRGAWEVWTILYVDMAIDFLGKMAREIGLPCKTVEVSITKHIVRYTIIVCIPDLLIIKHLFEKKTSVLEEISYKMSENHKLTWVICEWV